MTTLRRKTGKFLDKVALYPARAAEDEDDIQHFKHPQTETEKRELSGKKAYEHIEREQHMPNDAVIDSENENNDDPPTMEDKDPKTCLAQACEGEELTGQEQDARLSTKTRKKAKKLKSEPYRKRRLGALSISTAVSDYAYNEDDPFGGFGLTPRPFTELLDEITQWEIKSNPHEYRRFPFHIQKCADYQWLCLGKRRTGKTTLWRNVIPHIYKMYPFVYVFAQTNFTGAFHDYLPKDAIFPGYSEGTLYNLLEAQKQKVDINLRLYDKFSEYEDPEALKLIPNPYVHINFDDTVAQKGVHDSEALNQFAYYGRHFCFCTWINSQHGHALNPGKSFCLFLTH